MNNDIGILQEGEKIPCDECGCHTFGFIKPGSHCFMCDPDPHRLKDPLTRNKWEESLNKDVRFGWATPEQRELIAAECRFQYIKGLGDARFNMKDAVNHGRKKALAVIQFHIQNYLDEMRDSA